MASVRDLLLEPEYVSGVEQVRYLKDVEKARRKLHALITAEHSAPIMFRLALLDAATGGTNGSVMFDEFDLGLETAIDLCKQIKYLCPLISSADLVQLAGLVAVQVSGGPTFDFVPGRKDSGDMHVIPFYFRESHRGCHPDSAIVRDAFEKMGLSDKDIVVLHGAYTRSVFDNERRWCYSRHDGADKLLIRNSVFCELLCKDQEEMLDPVKKLLMEDVRFFNYVKMYAKDEDLFLKDFSATHKKISELGFIPVETNSNSLTRNWNGVAAAAALKSFCNSCFGNRNS